MLKRVAALHKEGVLWVCTVKYLPPWIQVKNYYTFFLSAPPSPSPVAQFLIINIIILSFVI